MRRGEPDAGTGVDETGAEIILQTRGQRLRGFVRMDGDSFSEMDAQPDGQAGRGEERDALGEIAALPLDENRLDRGLCLLGDQGETLLEMAQGLGIATGAFGKN